MQLFKNKNIKILAGEVSKFGNVDFLFNEITIEFLDNLSNEILSQPEAKKYPDLISFGFWIRKKNFNFLKKTYMDDKLRIGLGLTFHITPSNVPLNFAYSFVLSLIGGNSNIVRISNIKFDQRSIFFQILNNVFKKKKFSGIKKNNIFISYDYEKNKKITEELCMHCDCRVIWGSDKTINNIKKYETKIECKDLIFSDKYSISIINLNCKEFKIKETILNLAKKFYMDSLIFDQNACTSPHLILWYGKQNKNIYNIFWNELKLNILKGKLFTANEKNSIDKYLKLCEITAVRKEIKSYQINDSIFKMQLKKIPKDIHNLRVGYGFYFEYFFNDLKKLKKYLTPKIQTLTYAGFSSIELRNHLSKSKISNLNRVVPFGRSLEFNLIWDGYDLPRYFSKIIDIN